MKRLVFPPIAALALISSTAEARIETPGSFTTGPFHHAAAVAHQNLHRKPSAASAAPAQDKDKDKDKEKEPTRKRWFGRRTVRQGR